MKRTKESKDHVLNHQFGYGQKKEKTNLNKLELRNITDLKIYVADVFFNAFFASYKKNVLQFKMDKSSYKIEIENLSE